MNSAKYWKEVIQSMLVMLQQQYDSAMVLFYTLDRTNFPSAVKIKFL